MSDDDEPRSTSHRELPVVDVEQTKFSSSPRAIIAALVGAVTLGGTAMVSHYRLDEVEKRTTKLERSMGHVVRGMDRLEDHFGTRKGRDADDEGGDHP